MSRYTLKTLHKDKVLELYEHRSAPKLAAILKHDKFYHAGESDAFGEDLHHPDKFIIIDSQRYKLFEGSIEGTLAFLKKLR